MIEHLVPNFDSGKLEQHNIYKSELQSDSKYVKTTKYFSHRKY